MPDLVLLALAPATADGIRASLLGRVDSGAVEVRLIEAPLRAAIATVRDELGRIPLGVAARDRVEALEAIEHGADEALAIDGRDLVEVNDLLDRTRSRGMGRAQGEREKLEIAQAEKLAALGTLVAGVAHEINNPLTSIVLQLELSMQQTRAMNGVIAELREARDARRGLCADDVVRIASIATPYECDLGSDALESMQLAASTITDVVKDLRVFARPDENEAPELVRVTDLVEQILRLLGRELSSIAITEKDYGAEDVEVVVAPGRLTQVLTNVMVNAAHAIREVPRPVHRIRITLRTDCDAVAISISDTGPGIPPEAIERIFDPFYTTKRANLGTGLGLSISRNLMRKIGGDLIVESVFGEGATFIVIVPRPTAAELQAARVREHKIIPAASVERSSVMLVDDDTEILRAYSRVLGRKFDILLAQDAQEAIEMLSSGSNADVFVAELGFSVFDGAHLYRWLNEHRPDLAKRVVFVASEPGLPRHRQLLDGLSNLVLPKPTPASALVAAIADAARR